MSFLKRVTTLGLVPLFVMSLLLVAATPVAAATLNVCGTVDAYTAPTVGTDGSLTVDGDEMTIPAGTSIDAATSAMLVALATANADTCLTIETDDATGDVTSIALAASAQICGDVTLEADGDAVVDGVTIPADVMSAAVAGTLEAAADADAEACVTVMTDVDGDGGVLGAFLSADVTATICATVDAVDADSITLSGIELPLADSATVDADVDAGAEMGLELTAGVDGLSAVAVVDIAGCGTGGTSPGTGTNDDGTGGVGDDTATNGTGDTGGMMPDTAMAAARAISPLTLIGLVLIGLAAAWGAFTLRRRA